MDTKAASLRRLVRLHSNWLIFKLLGKELLSKEDLEELKSYGRLPLEGGVSLIEKAFALGRAEALLKKTEYTELKLDKLSRFQKMRYSSIDKLAIREAKLHAVRHFQALSDDITAGAFVRINQASQELLSTATIQGIQDEVAIAVKEKRTRQQLATSLGNRFEKGFRKDYSRIAITEMHRAQVRGIAMAIANKVDIYGKASGIDATVSVVPNVGACSDCKSLYLEENGNPRVIKLRDLLSLGTNADPGVKHTREEGLHTGWKAVLPPAHPSCFCGLVFVPPGMTWQNGKLQVTDEAKYRLSKAVDQGSMSPVITPPGPKSTQGTTLPQPASIPGVAAPSNEPGPGRPAGQKDRVGWEYWGSRNGTPNPAKGWEKTEGGAWARPPGMGGLGASPEDQAKTLVAQIEAISSWTPEGLTSSAVIDHLANGEIVKVRELREVPGATVGITMGAKEIGIAGNGSGILKPILVDASDSVNKEVAGYKLFAFLGSDSCPETTTRIHEGSEVSVQHWLKDFTVAGSALDQFTAGQPHKVVSAIIDHSSNKEAVIRQLQDIAIVDTVMRNKDRHQQNFMVNDDLSEVKAIDHGISFEIGFGNTRNNIILGLNSLNRRIRMPTEMKEKFKNTSLSDVKRAIGDLLTEWEVAQTYMRMKYMVHVQEKEGYLPGDYLEHRGFKDRRDGANDKFEDFVLDFLDKYSKDSSSLEYENSNYFKDIGILMDASYPDRDNIVEGRKEGSQFQYEKSIRNKKVLEEFLRAGKEDWAKEQRLKNKQIYENKMGELQIEKDKISADLKFVREENKKAQDFYRQAADKYAVLPTAKISEDISPKHLEIANKYVLAKQAYDKTYEKYTKILNISWDIEKEIEAKQVEAKFHLYDNIIPPGQEKIFEELDARIEAAKGGVKKKMSTSLKASKLEPIRADDIERNKRV